MSSKRMSTDEKRRIMLDIYHRTKTVYTEKEILALATKAGINANTVSDIHQGLINDGMIEKEKIGGSNYYWSFPTKQDWMEQKQYQETLVAITQCQEQIQVAMEQLQQAQVNRTDNDPNNNHNDENHVVDSTDHTNKAENTNTSTTNIPIKTISSRKEQLQLLEQMKLQKLQIQKELDTLQENDPLAIANDEKELKFVLEAANRWTDNIFNCKNYLIKKRNVDPKEACRMIGITNTFDYPEDKIPNNINKKK